MGGPGTRDRVLQNFLPTGLPASPSSHPVLQHLPYFFTSKWVLLLDSRPSENLAEIFQVPGLRMDKGGS